MNTTASLCKQLYASLRNWIFFKVKFSNLDRWTLKGVHLDVASFNSSMKLQVVRGNYEHCEATLLTKHAKKGDVVLELGGAVGFIGLLLLKNCGVERVVSCEPDPKLILLMRKNYAMNGLLPEIAETAIGPKNGHAKLLLADDFWENRIVESEQDVDQPAQVVSVSTMEYVLDNWSLHPSLLVCDIEGGERDVDWMNIPKSINRIVIELHPLTYGWNWVIKFLSMMIDNDWGVIDQSGSVYCLQRNQ